MPDTPLDPTFDFEEPADGGRWAILRLFGAYGASHARLLVLAGACSMLYPLLSLIPVYVLQTAIDAVLLLEEPFALPGLSAASTPTRRIDQLVVIVGVMIGAALLAGVLSAMATLTWGRFAQAVQHAVRTDAYARVQALDVGFFADQQTGQLLSILSNDVDNLDRFLERFLKDGVEIVVRFLGLATVLLLLHWQLALVALGVLPVLAVAARHFVARLRPLHKRVRSGIGRLHARIENNLDGIRVIKAFAGEAHELDRVATASRSVYAARWRLITTQATFFPAMSATNWLAFGTIFVVGGYWYLLGPPWIFTRVLTVGTLVAFLMYTQQLATPMMQASHLVDLYAEARASAMRVFALHDHEMAVQTTEDAIVPDRIRGEIKAEAVTFTYDRGDRPALRDISFVANPGSFLGIVGPTGAGKTTLAEMILRFHDPDVGRLTLDGHDLRDLDLRALRSAVGFVSQEPYLFSGTIRENVTYPGREVSDDAVERALRVARAWEFVERLPEGVDSSIGRRGVQLSGGQRQRIAIARALVTAPAVLVLDEATSHVDNETEALIQHALDDIANDCTTIVVAHRLSTVRSADRILVMADGEIVERGSHDDLLGSEGVYANLWRIQVGEVAPDPGSALIAPDRA